MGKSNIEVTKLVQEILNTKDIIENVQKHYENNITLLDDMVSYGTEKIVQCFNISDRNIADIVLLPTFSMKAMTMLDSIAILLRNGAVYNAVIPTRILFELSLYIEWILKSDTKERAKHYFAAEIRGDRLWALRTISGSPENQEFINKCKEFNFQKNRYDDIKKLAEEEVKNINEFLKSPAYKAINDMFDKLKGKKEYDPYWYKLSGIASIQDLAKKLNHAGQYNVFYAGQSKKVHSNDMRSNVLLNEGVVSFKPIRNLNDIHTVLNNSFSIWMEIMKMLIQKYIPDQMIEFNKTYIENWRGRFMNIPRYEENFVQTISAETKPETNS
ncbi:MAG: hypothetical protein A2X49_14100 [Lentisphaerae bacterium GWF2_52_8]|nr:MAG: hypothetical protein A2X49_14100 [Lentisphaerae bacterium GWF2_52_8]